jgi:hypothetical protein
MAGRSSAVTVLTDEVTFHGHPLLSAVHTTTIELTKNTEITKRGNCIVGISASKGVSEIPAEMKRLIRLDRSLVKLSFQVAGEVFDIRAYGDSRLSLSHKEDLVIRKSDYVCDRTLAIRADKAAKDLPRKMVRILKERTALGKLRISVQMN